MQKIDFYCKFCKKSMKMSYVVSGNPDEPVMPRITIRCHTNKCVRVVTMMHVTEKDVMEKVNREGKVYI